MPLPEPLGPPAKPATAFLERDFDEIEGEPRIIVDVRSPAEFADDHIPGARSVPLFDDSERAVVGTLYRQVGPGKAQDWGQSRVETRIETFVEDLEKAFEFRLSDSRPRLVSCARGGVRSAAVTELLRQKGYPVMRLRGGYRAYRARVREYLLSASLPPTVAIHGLTGVGKTRVLREIEQRRPGTTLDLEGIAGHRSSVLGDVGLNPVSQKRFESGLVRCLQGLSGPAVTEWEGTKVGNRQVPPQLVKELWCTHHVELTATLDQRVALLSDEYLGAASVDEICKRLTGLEHFDVFGPVGVARLSDLLRSGETPTVVRELLERHYDPRYLHSQRRFEMEQHFSLRDPASTAVEVLEWMDASVGTQG